MTLSALNYLLVDTLRDLFAAESQLIKAIPRLIEGVSSEELKSLLTGHLSQSERQFERLEFCAKVLQEKLSGGKSRALDVLVKEGLNVIESRGSEWTIDLSVLGLMRQIETYQVSSYEYACSVADVLGESEIVSELGKTLREEQVAEQDLTVLAHDIMDAIVADHSRERATQLQGPHGEVAR